MLELHRNLGSLRKAVLVALGGSVQGRVAQSLCRTELPTELKQNDVMMGTNLSAEGSGEQRKTDLSWNLVPRCRVPGQLFPPAGKHQFPHFHGRNDGFAAALCCFITLCCFCLSSLAAPRL